MKHILAKMNSMNEEMTNNIREEIAKVRADVTAIVKEETAKVKAIVIEETTKINEELTKVKNTVDSMNNFLQMERNQKDFLSKHNFYINIINPDIEGNNYSGGGFILKYILNNDLAVSTNKLFLITNNHIINIRFENTNSLPNFEMLKLQFTSQSADRLHIEILFNNGI